ncbi:hypothetical protein YC2023_100259 [Brassica napus]
MATSEKQKNRPPVAAKHSFCCLSLATPSPCMLSLLTLLPHLNGGSLRRFASSSPRFTSPSPYQRLDSTFRLLTTSNDIMVTVKLNYKTAKPLWKRNPNATWILSDPNRLRPKLSKNLSPPSTTYYIYLESVQGLNRYRRRLAPGLGRGSRAEGPNPPPR